MKLKEFVYTKKDGKKKNYEVLVLSETDIDIVGISLNALSDEERKIVKDMFQEFNEELEPYTKKAFRKFLKNGIQNIEE